MRQLMSPEYQAMQEQYHQQRPEYGTSGHKWAEHIRQFSDQLGSRDILDFGCGKESLQRSLPFPIKMFDPGIPHRMIPPEPADMVVCTDVLEHIEPEYLDNVLDELRDLTKKLVFLEVATSPAVKFLPDGRNAHLIQEQAPWWLPKLIARWNPHSFQRLDNAFVFLGMPYPPEPESPQQELPL